MGSEVSLVEWVAATACRDIRSGDGSQGSGFLEACCNGGFAIRILAVDYKALLELEFTLGDVRGGGDGTVVIVGIRVSRIGGNLNGVVGGLDGL